MSGWRRYRERLGALERWLAMSERSNFEEQVIALAGVAQAARMVDQVAKTAPFPVHFSKLRCDPCLRLTFPLWRLFLATFRALS